MYTAKHTKIVRVALVFIGIVSLLVAGGLSLRISPLASIWPLSDSLSVERFLGAYLAGIGASLLWIGVSGDLRAAVAGAISLSVIYSGLAITWFALSFGAPPGVRPVAFMVAALASGGLALYFRRFRIRDTQPMPRVVHSSFVVFALLLAFVGVALLTGIPNTFFTALSTTGAALIGWCFLGSTTYFLYGLVFPIWRNACAPLWGFLAYDVALIGPLVSKLTTMDAAHRPALLMNIAVLVFSGALAISYLLIARATRVWSPRQAQNIREAAPLKTLGVATRKTASVVKAALSGE
jgi:hypothetical protein